MRRLLSLILVALVFSGAQFAGAEVLVSWNLDGLSRSHDAAVEGEPTLVKDGVTVSDLTFSSSLKATAWSDALTVYANSLAGDISGAIAKESYFTFTVTPGAGKQISLERIFNRVSVNTGNLDEGATIKLVLLSSVDGFAANQALDSFSASHPSGDSKATESTGIFDLGAVQSLQNISGPVEFRIYAVLEKGVGNRLGYGHIFYQDGQDDLRVEGTINNVSEGDAGNE